MITSRSLFQEIHDNDEAYRLLCSIAAQDEDQGGWENERIATLVRDPELAPKVARHGSEEHKHGRIFAQLLRRRSLEQLSVPPELDYCMLLEQRGIGLSHERLDESDPLSDHEIISYLVHSRVTEQRAAEEIRLLCQAFDDEPGIGRAVRHIAADEENHLAYCHEELLRLSRLGNKGVISTMLHAAAQAEIRTHRDVALGVMRRMGEILRWPAWKRGVLAAGIHALYLYERSYGWHRMVNLRMPSRRNAMGPSPVPVPEAETA